MKYAAIILLVFALSINGFAQRGLGGISWNISTPGEEMQSFVEETTYRGFNIEFRSFVTNNLSIGGFTGWNIFDEQIRGETIELDFGAVTGTQLRYINSFPIMLTAHLHIGKPRETIRLYAGGGVGTYYIVQRFEMGVRAIEADNWHWGVAPEAGMLLAMDYVSLNLGLRYNYALPSGTSITGEEKEWSYWTINIGFMFPTF